MSLLGAFMPKAEERASQVTMWGDWGDSSSTYAGVNVTTTSSLQLLTVYGCVRFICDGISTLPVDVYRRGSDGAAQEVDLPPLVVEPTLGLDFTAWATQFLSSLLLAGNFYGIKVRRGAEVVQVIPLDPTTVKHDRERGQRIYRVNGERFDAPDILHVRGIMWPGSEVGLSPVEAARQSIGVGVSSQEYAARYFGDDPTPPGVIETDSELTPDVAREIARSWSRAHSGKSKRALPGVLQGGAKWKPTLVNNEQAQFLETRKFTATEIAAQMFLIDPAEMGLPVEGSSLTYTNQEQRNIRKVQVTFLPWISRLEAAITSCLSTPDYFKLNVNALLRGDSEARINGYKVALDAGFMTVEQVRELEDWAPLPEKAPAPPDLVNQIEAVGQLIRAGFEPAASLALVGLPDIAHTGLVPITVTTEDKPGPSGGIQ